MHPHKLGPGVEGRAEARRRVSGHVARGHHPPPRRPPRPLPAHPRGTGQGLVAPGTKNLSVIPGERFLYLQSISKLLFCR